MPLPTADVGAGKPTGTPEQLTALDARCVRRSLTLRTPTVGAVDVDRIKHHVQGITRTDQGKSAAVICSVSGKARGTLWFGRFDLVADASRPGQLRLADVGTIVSELDTATKHPGGIQASGELLAVPCEADSGWARIDIYDVEDLKAPFLMDTLPLDNWHVTGLSKAGSSKAGWLAFHRVGGNEYLLFIGGRSYAQKQGWFFRYTPGKDRPWSLEGTFTGTPISTGGDAWGPQNGAAFVRTGSDQVPYLITFGSKGTERRDKYRTRVRCFTTDRDASGGVQLRHEPSKAPLTVALASAKLDASLNQRWGSTAYVSPDDRLHVYFTGRNARPNTKDQVHELEIVELVADPTQFSTTALLGG